MTRSRLLLAVAAVLAGATVLFVVLGAVFNLVLVAAAVPFGLATYLLWLHATGRLAVRVRHRSGEEARREARREATWSARSGPTGTRGPSGRAGDPVGNPSMDRAEALDVLGLSPGADQPAIRRAYRERVKAVHPDTEAGNEAQFRRVTAAYDRLRRRGKG